MVMRPVDAQNILNDTKKLDELEQQRIQLSSQITALKKALYTRLYTAKCEHTLKFRDGDVNYVLMMIKNKGTEGHVDLHRTVVTSLVDQVLGPSMRPRVAIWHEPGGGFRCF